MPGAVVAKMRGNKGYGFADLSRRKRLDPITTHFRIGSASRVFNAMAAMTLVDRGEIGLD